MECYQNIVISITFLLETKRKQWFFVFLWTISTIDLLILYVISASFNDHIYSDNSVFWLYCRRLKSSSPKYIFVLSLTSFTTFALNIKFEFGTDSGEDQYFFTIQLHPYSVTLGLSSDLLMIYSSCSCTWSLPYSYWKSSVTCVFFQKKFFRKLKGILLIIVFTYDLAFSLLLFKIVIGGGFRCI